DLPALMPYVHLPVQSGSDRVLEAMNRKHTAAHYRDIVARMHAARSDLAFSSDFIVGFPGESEEDFGETLTLIEDIGFAGAYSFMYSPRAGTPAAEMAQIPQEEKSERLQRLQALVTRQQRAFYASFVGRTLDVLLEKTGRETGQLVGKSPYLQPVTVVAPASLIGEVVPVAITGVGTNSLFGVPADAARTHVPEQILTAAGA